MVTVVVMQASAVVQVTTTMQKEEALEAVRVVLVAQDVIHGFLLALTVKVTLVEALARVAAITKVDPALLDQLKEGHPLWELLEVIKEVLIIIKIQVEVLLEMAVWVHIQKIAMVLMEVPLQIAPVAEAQVA
jgi:hypothetical protein